MLLQGCRAVASLCTLDSVSRRRRYLAWRTKTASATVAPAGPSSWPCATEPLRPLPPPAPPPSPRRPRKEEEEEEEEEEWRATRRL